MFIVRLKQTKTELATADTIEYARLLVAKFETEDRFYTSIYTSDIYEIYDTETKEIKI